MNEPQNPEDLYPQQVPLKVVGDNGDDLRDALNAALARHLPEGTTVEFDIRESSGGLPFVKALGVALDHRGIVQVSMNMTNFTKTSLLRVFEEIRRESERRGARVLESELVGLVPAAALPHDPARSLLLTGFSSNQILEQRLKDER